MNMANLEITHLHKDCVPYVLKYMEKNWKNIKEEQEDEKNDPGHCIYYGCDYGAEYGSTAGKCGR